MNVEIGTETSGNIFVSKIRYFVFAVFFTRVAHIEIVGGVEGPEVKPGLDVGLPALILDLPKYLLVSMLIEEMGSPAPNTHVCSLYQVLC